MNQELAFADRSQKTELSQDNPRRILYVDNDQALVDLIKQVLERLGYEVVITTRCTEAIRLVESQPEGFDLVITDMNMSNMNGLELARAILGIRDSIPIILCTGFGGPDTEEEAKEAGIRGIILKPFLMEDLSKIVREAMEGRNPQAT